MIITKMNSRSDDPHVQSRFRVAMVNKADVKQVVSSDVFCLQMYRSDQDIRTSQEMLAIGKSLRSRAYFAKAKQSHRFT